MKKRNPSGGQNGQLVHWWVLIHSGRNPQPHTFKGFAAVQRRTAFQKERGRSKQDGTEEHQ
jgi:hypothetical protein